VCGRFEALDVRRHGVRFELTSRIAAGDACCELRLVKAAGEGGRGGEGDRGQRLARG
jgi:hypothetical protein